MRRIFSALRGRNRPFVRRFGAKNGAQDGLYEAPGGYSTYVLGCQAVVSHPKTARYYSACCMLVVFPEGDGSQNDSLRAAILRMGRP